MVGANPIIARKANLLITDFSYLCSVSVRVTISNLVNFITFPIRAVAVHGGHMVTYCNFDFTVSSVIIDHSEVLVDAGGVFIGVNERISDTASITISKDCRSVSAVVATAVD